MAASLSVPERQIGLLISVLLALMGLVMAAVARHGVMSLHGFMALGLGVGLVLLLGGALYDTEPPTDRLQRYYDAPTRFGIVMTLVWAMIGMGVGVWVAAFLYWPEGTPPWPATSFDRLRPVHTTAIIFGFGGNALIATSFHVLQRTSRARMADSVSPWVVLIGYNLFCVWAVTSPSFNLRTEVHSVRSPAKKASGWSSPSANQTGELRGAPLRPSISEKLVNGTRQRCSTPSQRRQWDEPTLRILVTPLSVRLPSRNFAGVGMPQRAIASCHVPISPWRIIGAG